MSLKAELEIWASALKCYDEEDFEQALSLFSRIADSAKILTNMGLIYATLGEHEAAVEQFISATNLDQYLAVAYFQCGVSNFLLCRYELALKDFEEALLYLRGNQAINYEQLGLKFRLFSAEVLFNKGLAQIYMGRARQGLADMDSARQQKATVEHDVIDDAIRDRGEGYTVFSIPVGVLYRPSQSKLKNSKSKDYMGKAKLVAASETIDTYNTSFSGATRLKAGITPTGVFIEEAGLNGRTAPLATPRNTTEALQQQGAGLGRANTLNGMLNLSADSNGRGADSRAGVQPSAGLGLRRSNSTTRLPVTTDTRALSVKRPDTAQDLRAPLSTVKAQYNQPRTNETRDDSPDTTSDGTAARLRGVNAGVAAWARTNANATHSPMRTPSRPTTPSVIGGVSLRRKRTRYRARTPNRWEEEEEGYVSGDYEEEMSKIRIKLHYQDDMRGMAIFPETTFDEFLDRVTSKFGRSLNGLGLKFKDEDGSMVTLQDESDYELAIETARENAKGRPDGKLEIWCQDA